MPIGGKTIKKARIWEWNETFVWRSSSGIGGGISQISNSIHWLVLHSELQLVERANHSFDPFADDGQVLPFGSGAAVFLSLH